LQSENYYSSAAELKQRLTPQNKKSGT